MLGVLWCFVSSLHLASWQQRHLALCGVLCYPLHHGACVVVVLCTPALRYSSLDDPGLPLDTAKLHTRHSLQHVWHTLLLSSSAFPAPSLPPPPCLVVCVFVGVWCFSFPLCNFLYLHLGERSLELSSLRGCFLVRLLRWLMLNVWQGKSCAY